METLRPFQSSSIAWARYDRVNRVLHIWFAGNDTEYEYAGVTAKEWKALDDAPSKGQYVNAHIKPFHKVSNPR